MALVIGRSLLAVVFVAAMTAVLYRLGGELTNSTITLLFLVPVGASAMALGLAPGILAAIASFLALNYFFTQPHFTLIVARTQDLLTLIVFLIVAISISQLVGRMQTSLLEAQSRERDVIYLYELMAMLAGHRKTDAVARTAALRLSEIFQTRALEVIIQPDSRSPAQVFRAPIGVKLPEEQPDQVVALVTPRGFLGELHLWFSHLQSPAEERLLNTFAGQIALAVERVNLALAENRAKILEESDQMKTALLSSVSHELRTPLATIRAAATSLRSGNVSWDSTAREELISAIDEESDHLNRLVGNLLDMTRIESGALKPNRQWNILADILEGTVSRMRHAITQHDIDIDMPDDLPLVPVDHMQIDQVFTNLISNAIKYAPPETKITFRARVQDAEFLLVEAHNEGPQVPEEDLGRIFDKFYRVTSADRVTGTGLGLSICKGIIEAHGGRIWAANKVDGLTFYFTLPLTLDGRSVPLMPAENETTE
ncbi:MAG TPA: ATP-binding protein [Anaerolineae bacterium]